MTLPHPIPLPGEVHPAHADRAEAVRTADLERFDYPEVDNAGAGYLEATYTLRTLTRRRVVHPGLLPAYGWWEWWVWVDHAGRYVADDPERTRWHARPWGDPHRMAAPEWNPPATPPEPW